MKDFLNIKSLIIALGITILTGAIPLFLPIDTKFTLLIPFASFTIDLSPKLAVGTLCGMIYSSISLGWPFVFFQNVSSSSCSNKIIFNPIGLIGNLTFFLLLIHFFRKNKMKIIEDNPAKRIRNETWFFVVASIYFSISIRHPEEWLVGLIASVSNVLFFVFWCLSSLFLLWVYYQIHKQKKGLFKVASILGFTLGFTLIAFSAFYFLSSLFNWWNLEVGLADFVAMAVSVVLALIYFDIGLFYRNLSKNQPPTSHNLNYRK